MEFDCEYMTAMGCPARDTAKNLMLLEMIESNTTIEFCKEQCCRDCKDHCSYRCGRKYDKNEI